MKFIVSLLFFFTALILTAQPGTLDNTFGAGGKVIENSSAPYVEVLDAVVQTDGKTIVLAGAAFNHATHVVLIRYNTNGTPDHTFSGDGIADSPLGQPEDAEYPSAVKLQPDGKILVCGGVHSSPDKGFVVRYNTKGTYDSSFGGTGIVYIPDLDITDIDNLAVLPNDQLILITSVYLSNPGPDLILIKLNSDGSRNGSFGPDGIVKVQATDSYNPDYRKIEIQADGKFIIGGNYYAFSTSKPNFLLVRVNSNGTLDNTYGTNGIVSFTPGTADSDSFRDMAIQPDGKIVAAGWGTDAFRPFLYTYITRINPNGTRDHTFGTNGVQLIHLATSGFGSDGQICVQSDGKVIIAGFSLNAPGNYTISAARLTAAGVLDASFDDDGVALMQVNNYGSCGIAPVQQSDGKIMLAGFAGNGTAFSATIGRFTPAGQTDNTVSAGSTSIVYTGNGASYEKGSNVMVQPDQKIVNIRNVSNGFLYNVSLSRHTSAGIPDSSFGLNGKTSMDLPGYFYRTHAALLDNGKIIVAGDYTDFLKGGQVALIRFNASGHADSSFGTNGKVFFNTAGNGVNEVVAADFQADGKAVILTQETVDLYQGSVTYLLRLNADGSYDNTFNGTGKMTLSDTAGYGTVHVQPDGKILLSYSNVNTGMGYTSFVRRLNANGTIDVSFNGGSALQTGLNRLTLALQPDGKIVMADGNGKTVRLNANGSFDNTFDSDGIVESVYGFDYDNGVEDIKVQPDGSIILGGSQNDTAYNNHRFQAICLQSNGSIDLTFGTNGIALVPVVPGNDNYCNAMALQADGRILLAGITENYDLQYGGFAMIRLNSSNVGPTYTFTGNGNWDAAVNWSNNAIPPATLPAGSSIFIDPVAGGECVLTVTQHISAGATFTVKTGKKFRVVGGLIIQ